MKLRQPLALLLGGLLSASSIGCSAVTAVVGNSQPANRTTRGTADRMAAIGQVYESQGRYDQAELMYRKALKQNPGNTAVRGQLQLLAQRKNGKTFSSAGTDTLVAAATVPAAKSASAVASKTHAVATQLDDKRVTAKTLMNDRVASSRTVQADLTNGISETALEIGAISPVTYASSELRSNDRSVTTAASRSESASESLEARLVTAEEILEVVDSPADHSQLLLDGLRYGDSLETQCLAATLLGDCDNGDPSVRKALEIASRAASDPHLRLAICDSRIQRGEHDETTLASLLDLVEFAPTDVKLQACTDLRHFAGTASETKCQMGLVKLLNSDVAELRASSAVILSDFRSLPESAKSQLNVMVKEDADSEVREAVRATLNRIDNHSSGTTHPIIVSPR